MRRTIVTFSGWFVALLVAVSSATWVHSQSTLPHGGFVIGQDDSRWVVGNGVKYPIAFVADDAGLLDSMATGGPVATVDEALAAISGSAPAPAAPPAPANPAETLIGQRATMCAYGVPIELEVVRVDWVKTVVDATAPGNGMWAILIVNVHNLGVSDEGIYTFMKLVDERGREFRWAQYPPDPIELNRAYGVKGSYERFTPGVVEESIASFVVPSDVRSLTLVDASLEPERCR